MTSAFSEQSFEQTFESIGRALQAPGPPEAIEFTLLEGRASRRLCLVSVRGSRLDRERHDGQAAVELLTDAESWDAIRSGRRSALELFGEGALRFRGEHGNWVSLKP